MMNAVNERLATQIQEQYQLNQPIKADRGDPFAIQVKDYCLSKSLNRNFGSEMYFLAQYIFLRYRLLGVIFFENKLLLQPDVVFDSESNGCYFSSLAPPGGEKKIIFNFFFSK